MASLKGTWTFVAEPNLYAYRRWQLDFSSNTKTFWELAIDGDQNDELFYYGSPSDSGSVYMRGIGWLDDAYRTITLDGAQEVDDDFYEWFTANAVKNPEVTYNGKSTVLTNGQTATLKCAKKRAATDIIIDFGTDGSITYNGAETVVGAGKTATLACNGKTMKSHVVVSIWNEPGLYDANGNSVATWSRLTNDYGMDAANDYFGDGLDDVRRPYNVFTSNSELSAGTTLIVPGTVWKIGQNAFSGLDNLTEVVILNGTTKINLFAFFGCENLKSVTVPGSVTEIGISAFDGCTSLTKATLSQGLKKIAGWAFRYCPISNLVLPKGLETIGGQAFQGCKAKRVTIPSSVTQIGEGAFASCQNMQDIFVEDGNEQYKDETFIGDDGKEHHYLLDLPATTIIQFPGGYRGQFKIPNGVLKVFGYSFYESLVLDVTIPNSLENIEEFAFAGSYNFNLLEIPQSILKIGAFAFRNCANLRGKYDDERGEYVLNVWADKLQTIAEGLFCGCSALVNIYFEDGTLRIGADAFIRCGNLLTISFADTLQEIGECIIDTVSEGLQIIFRGAQELWEQVDIGADNEQWQGNLVFSN